MRHGGTWTADTPTSRQRLKTETREKIEAREQERVRKPIRTEPNAEEIAEAQRIHDAGLVRTPEQQQAYHAGMDKLAKTATGRRNRHAPFQDVDQASAISDRWARR
jgi:uncharacterized protein with von Willebrand factor type A (vWA) domain